jgi:uncharacterized protein DUF4185
VSLRLPNRRLFAVVALIAAAVGGACDDASSGGGARNAGGNRDEARITFDDGLPVVMSVRVVCRLASDTPSAIAANITGADGSQSVVAGGRSYWFFGDTVRKTADRQDVIPAAVATTTDTDARDCLDLRFKTSADGVVEPMFPRLDETTAWPDGVLALDDGSIVFYMVKAYRQSPFAWNVGSVGLGRIPPGSVDGERVVESIWEDEIDFGTRLAGVRSPVRRGDDVIVYLALEDRRNIVARAPIALMAESGAYTYWDGNVWSNEPRDAAAMWTSDATEYPPDNGVQVTFDAGIGMWVALYNDRMSSVKVRLAHEPWGPWSEPVSWFDCRPLVQDVYPYCYTGELHRHLTRDEGSPMYMTISSQMPYDVTLIELHMATAIHEWRSPEGARRYAATAPAAEYEDAGVAFYASAAPAPGLSAVYEEPVSGGYRYTVVAPAAAVAPATGGAPAFYAYSTPSDGAVRTIAVRELDGMLAAGGEDGEIRFFVPCPVAGCDESSPAE